MKKAEIAIRVERRDDTPMGEWNGGVVYHAIEVGPLGRFRGCVLGRGATEAGALADFVRRGNMETIDGARYTVADLTVTERRDYAFQTLARDGEAQS